MLRIQDSVEIARHATELGLLGPGGIDAVAAEVESAS